MWCQLKSQLDSLASRRAGLEGTSSGARCSHCDWLRVMLGASWQGNWSPWTRTSGCNPVDTHSRGMWDVTKAICFHSRMAEPGTVKDTHLGVQWLELVSFLSFFWSGVLYPLHVEVPRLGAEWELQLPAYTTATAMRDPSCVCSLHLSSQQCQILNPLSQARDRTSVLMDTNRVVSAEPRWRLLELVFVHIFSRVILGK